MTRKAAFLFFAVALIVICLPALAVSIGRQKAPSSLDREPDTESSDHANNTERIMIRFYRVDLQRTETIDLEEYLVGVVLAEMPASFEIEALKAQAVAARTYTLNRSRYGGGTGCGNAPDGADICSDSTHCQAWTDPLAEVSQWSDDEKEINLNKVRQAVTETAGEVITFKGCLIEAVYHSTCGGKTESSQAIWSGGPTEYLQVVDCSYCKHSPYYRRDNLIPYERISEALLHDPAIPVAAFHELPLEVVEVTAGGRVGKFRISDIIYEGKEIRRLLELPSTAFSWKMHEDGLLFQTRGHGHGVGLCQYGADGAAAEGLKYRQIIAMYYPGTTISQFNR